MGTRAIRLGRHDEPGGDALFMVGAARSAAANLCCWDLCSCPRPMGHSLRSTDRSQSPASRRRDRGRLAPAPSRADRARRRRHTRLHAFRDGARQARRLRFVPAAGEIEDKAALSAERAGNSADLAADRRRNRIPSGNRAGLGRITFGSTPRSNTAGIRRPQRSTVSGRPPPATPSTTPEMGWGDCSAPSISATISATPRFVWRSSICSTRARRYTACSVPSTTA